MTRKPKQRRALDTVATILDAVVRIASKGGIGALTTNRIAEVAGVSIGSVYQYFPDKQAIFDALHEKHVEDMSRVVERTLVEHASASRAAQLRAVVEAVIDANAEHPACNAVLSLSPPKSKTVDTFAVRLQGVLRLVLTKRKGIEARTFTAATMIDALGHAAAMRRPRGVSLAVAKAEAVQAVLKYLQT